MSKVYVPGAHAVHEVAPEPLNVPKAHGEHDEDAAVALNVPAGQLLHHQFAVKPQDAPTYWPAGQGAQQFAAPE